MPENTSVYQARLNDLRIEIAKAGLDGFIVPRTDEFQGEFLAAYAERLGWLTGFTGSAGVAVILADKAVVLSDGRYTIQLKQQLDLSLYAVGNSIENPAHKWMAVNAPKGARVGYDPWLHTPKQIEVMRKELEATEIVLKPVESNLIDLVWHDQPERPRAPVVLFPETIAGKNSAQKRAEIVAKMKEQGADALILSALDSICWLLNVRGGDVDYTPLVLSYAVLHGDGSVDLFVYKEKISEAVRQDLGSEVRIIPFDRTSEKIASLAKKTIWLDKGNVPAAFETMLAGCKILDLKDPCVLPKARKTQEEQASIRETHVKDGRAVRKFLEWLEREVPKGNLSEISVAEKLEEFRREDVTYKGQSFPTIAGFSENGAIIHYRATLETNKQICGNGILLLDSGGQYEGGTTDITRTIAIGTPTEEMRVNYTRVLKGHIALSMAKFPEGTTGAQIDTLARQPLWQAGLDYAHGTGHGVGCYLGVHEEAATISPRGQQPLETGMLLSNEPGYYKEGAYGIRIENLVLVIEAGFCAEIGKKMLGFETVTLAPYDARLIVEAMLSGEEKAWLQAYQDRLDKL